jgi:hypothetical protein
VKFSVDYVRVPITSSYNGQGGNGTLGRWLKMLNGELENNSRKPKDLVRKLA